MKIPNALTNAIVVLVSLVWAGNFLASVFLPDYRGDSSLNFVFMTIVGGALALRTTSEGAAGLAARLVAAVKPPPPEAPERPVPPAAPEERP